MIKPGYHFATIEKAKLLQGRGTWFLAEITFRFTNRETIRTPLGGKHLDHMYRELIGTQCVLPQDINSVVGKECVVYRVMFPGFNGIPDISIIQDVYSTEGFAKK